jgi:hypothetical protein
MKQNSKEDIVKKWAPILENIGLTGSKADWMSEWAELHSKQEIENSKPEEFPSLLPIAMKVAAKTIAQDLIFASQEEIDEVKNKVLTENRDGKIEAIVDGKEFTEKKLEEDPEYQKLMKKGVTPMSAPSGQLFYLDFKYESHKKTRRAGRKNKKKNNGSL